MSEDTTFKVGDWITPNPEFPPSGAHDGRLTFGRDYCVLEAKVSKHSNRVNYAVMCNDGEVRSWLEKCWVAFDPTKVERMHPEESLDEIHQGQEAYKEIVNGHK